MFKSISWIVTLGAIIAVQCTDTSNETVVTYDTHNSDSSNNPLIVEDNLHKHESLKSCFTFDLEPDEYEMFPNKTAYVSAYNKTYKEEYYVLIGNYLRICAPTEVLDDDDLPPSHTSSATLNYITIIGLAVSMTFLLLHLIVFVIVPDLHNLPGYNLASLCLSLFISYIMLMFLADATASENSVACTAVAVLTQFFFLGSFLWMFVMSFDVFRSIQNATENLRTSTKGFSWKKYMYNSLVCWGTAFVFTAAALIADNVEGISESYKPRFEKTCWFFSKLSLLSFFAGPVFILIFLNFVLFGITAYNIFSNRMKIGDSSKRAYIKKNYLTYLRLAAIMGITWITGLLAPIFEATWLWFLFAILNTFQGLIIFIAFTCTSKVKKYFMSNLLSRRRASEQTLTTPTFQSYCFYANSIEKDLDKIVENKDKSNPIDTIVIHL